MKCLIVDDEPLALDVLETHLKSYSDLELVARCTNAIQAAEILRNQHVDLMFIDIQMPEITGIEFVRTLENPPLLVFTTAYAEYAIEGFELDAIDYLLKPISLERFDRAISKAREYFQIKHGDEADKSELEDEHIFVKANQKLIKISYDEIKYVEAFADYVKIFIPEKRIVTLQTMKNMERKLPADKFCRIHRSFIVGLKHIETYNTSEVEVDGKKLPIGKNFKETFMEKMKGNNVL
ncbi:MAG: response regulator transcription factor [Flavobacteriales bacterium]|nr:response regulator transcription factor [Bacteroidota bacterium]MCB9239933.1 response regulator transcription factor [Flavobacteriales bacterium]